MLIRDPRAIMSSRLKILKTTKSHFNMLRHEIDPVEYFLNMLETDCDIMIKNFEFMLKNHHIKHRITFTRYEDRVSSRDAKAMRLALPLPLPRQCKNALPLGNATATRGIVALFSRHRCVALPSSGQKCRFSKSLFCPTHGHRLYTVVLYSRFMFLKLLFF